MIGPLRKLFRPRGASASMATQAAIPAGQRVYAIGDIHGRLDLLDAMIAAIALSQGLPVHTCNPKDFRGIRGLQVVAVGPT